MAVPASGELSMLGLANEKYENDYDAGEALGLISMYDLFNGGNTNGSEAQGGYEVTNTNSTAYPDTSTPHKMSEWYSYDHDASSGGRR
tara:strand:+ start:2590 stop:2853 length:264 start_codon:yes stop_codon:yes gene_type:complete